MSDNSKPLAQKLGLQDGMRVWFDGMPDTVRAHIDEAGLTLSVEEVPSPGIALAHIFVTDKTALAEKLEALRKVVDPGGYIWISWPTCMSDPGNGLNEDAIRSVALSVTRLDKVQCRAVDENWHGLQLVMPAEQY